MNKPVVWALAALAAVLLLLTGGDAALAQVVCTGDGRHTGRMVVGTPGADVIDCNGSTANLVIAGLGGDDWLEGGSGNDVIDGGPGNDILISHGGIDFLRGGPGIDFLGAGEGDDLLRGEAGDDLLYGGRGDDVIYGGLGDDFMAGGEGIDLCDGQDGAKDLASPSCELPAHVP